MTTSIVIQHIIFFAAAIMLLVSGLMVIVSRNPVRGVLFLVLAFFACATLWMLMEAEFLSLVLIFVYVGAVMTLFLFVVMMLNIDVATLRSGTVRYLPFAVFVMVLLVAIMVLIIGPKHFYVNQFAPPLHPADYSNVKSLGKVLYTDYVYPFEIAAVLLLVAIISAIALAFRGVGKRKSQNIAKQVAVRAKDRLRIIDLDEKGRKS